MKCEKCGNEIEIGKKFCRFCGNKLENKNKFCRKCGQEINPNSKFCRFCGNEINISLSSENNKKVELTLNDQIDVSQKEKEFQKQEFFLETDKPEINQEPNVLKPENVFSSNLEYLKELIQKNKTATIVFSILTVLIVVFSLQRKNTQTRTTDGLIEISDQEIEQEIVQPTAKITQQTFMDSALEDDLYEESLDDENPTVGNDNLGEIIRVMDYCSIYNKSPIEVSANDDILIFDGWLAETQNLVQDHIDSVVLDIRLDGEPLELEYTGEIVPDYDNNGNVEGYDAYFEKNIGPLSPGTYMVEAVVTWSEKIYDGWDYYGPGTNNPQISGFCEIIVE